jgi:hypothetical protein
MRTSPIAVFVLACLALPAAAAPRSTPGAAVADYWSWFSGSGSTPGAYKAPELPCQQVHLLVNQYSRAGKRFVTQDGQEYAYNFLISLGANARICRANDAPTIPAEAMMPQRFPVSFMNWLEDHDADKAIRRAAMAYVAAADAEEDPVGKLTAQRKLFWDLSMKAVLADPAQRASICAAIEPANKGCAEQLQTRTLDELYAAGHRAGGAAERVPAAPPPAARASDSGKAEPPPANAQPAKQ